MAVNNRVASVKLVVWCRDRRIDSLWYLSRVSVQTPRTRELVPVSVQGKLNRISVWVRWTGTIHAAVTMQGDYPETMTAPVCAHADCRRASGRVNQITVDGMGY